jgi:hypothetical protein
MQPSGYTSAPDPPARSRSRHLYQRRRPAHPPGAIDTWQETGPLRVRRELAQRLRLLADRGLLRIDDPERAALHLMLLVSSSNPSYGRDVPSEQEIDEMVTAGVRTFLHGYGR